MEHVSGSQSSQHTAASEMSVAHDIFSAYDSDSTHFSPAEDIRNEGDLDTSSSDDGTDVTQDEVDWNGDFIEDVTEFSPEPHAINPEVMISGDSNQLDILRELISEEMVLNICEESNRYAAQKNVRGYQLLTTQEFWRFIAINLAMGIVKKPAMADYWAVKTLFQTPFFGSVMTRDRYLQLLRCLHFIDNTSVHANNTDRFIKLGSFMDDLFKNVRRIVKLGEYLCLDESFVPFKGKLSILQYNPKKRARFGVKLFKLADCLLKVIIAILPYQGKSTKMKYRHLQKELGFGGAAVLSMLDPYFNKGHRVVVDNYFNSPKLARYLKAKKTYVLGTVQKRRKGMPRNGRMTRKLKKGEVEVFSDGDILVERWHDRRDVCMLNTFMDHQMIHVESTNPNNTRMKPGTVLLYNAKMGAVDDADKVTAPLASRRKSCKWYRKVAFHLVDLAMYNSFQLYKHVQKKKMKYRSFVEEVIGLILAQYPNPNKPLRGRPAHQRDDQRLTGNHFPHKVLKENGKSSKADCVYCKIVWKKRTSTVYGCRQCQKRLCIGPDTSCFELYHTQSTLRKVQKQTPPAPQLVSAQASQQLSSEESQLSQSVLA